MNIVELKNKKIKELTQMAKSLNIDGAAMEKERLKSFPMVLDF
jgi:hypothetical protein